MLKKIFVHPVVFFISAAIVFLWPVSFFLFSFKNDALTYYYPVRTLISDALNNGELPLWTPFINFGYPLHADFQSGAWNPVIWLFSYITKYTLTGFHVELLCYVAFSGIGFYYLCRHLNYSKIACLIAGLAYQFSGFTIDSIQFFNCISAVCYIPFIIFFFLRTTERYRLADAATLAFFLFLLFTGGYPSFFIVTGYVLLAWIIYMFFSAGSKPVFLKNLTLSGLAAVIIFLMLSAPALFSFYQQLPLIQRGGGQPLPFVLQNSLHPAAMLSLVFPYATTATDFIPDTNVIMRNMYIGIIPLLFVGYAFYCKPVRTKKTFWFFVMMMITMTGLAWGRFFFLRQAAYYLLPFMNTFRHPALFRFYAMFFMLLIAGSAINHWQSYKTDAVRFFKPALYLCAFGCIAIILLSLFRNKNIPISFSLERLKTFFLQAGFETKLLVQSCCLLLMLFLAMIAIVHKKNLGMIAAIVTFDIFLATQLNIPMTVIGSKSFRNVEALINRNKEAFPLPDGSAIVMNASASFGNDVITGSTLPFTKKIGRNDYYVSPGNLLLQDSFYESALRDKVFTQPVLYFQQKSKASDISVRINRAEKLFSGGECKITKLTANTMRATINCSDSGLLVYHQNFYPGWKVFMDGSETKTYKADITFMAIECGPGQHQIDFKYRPTLIIYAWYISTIAGILILAWLLFYFSRNYYHRYTKRQLQPSQ